MAREKCSECKGKGEVPCPVDYGGEWPHDEECVVCRGDTRTRVPCYGCEGEGYVDWDNL